MTDLSNRPMEYEEALKIMDETVAFRVREIEQRAETEETFEARMAMKRLAQSVHDAFNKIRNG
jgi:hypothetical protein